MKKIFLHIHLAAMIFIAGTTGCLAQSGLFVPKDGKIFFTGTSTIFSNVLNKGNFGVGKNAMVNFTGKQWENDYLSQITDEAYGGDSASGAGGFVKFLSTDTIPQILTGGYNAALRKGPSFSNIEVQSKGGLHLSGGNTKIRTELMLTDGLVYVHDNILLMGEGTPGKISGYDSLHFIVTDNTVNEGFLLRESITDKDGVVVFPLGSRSDAYTPAAVSSRTSRPDSYYMNVRDGVRYDSISGQITIQGVNKTWQAGKQYHPNEDDADISLQHQNADEGSFFRANRANAYVSQFARSRWNMGTPQGLPAPGSITTGPALVNSGVNTKTFNGTISNSSYFTKLTGRGDTSKLKTVLWFNGYRLDQRYVRVYWKTNPEVYNQYFIVQRRLSTETDFRNIDTISTKSINGLSTRDLNYEIRDDNNYIGVSFYRLVLMDFRNQPSLSNIIAVAPMPGKFKLLLWPNPTPNRFYVGLNGEVSVRAIAIYNAIGQRVRLENVNGRSILEFYGLIPGTYFVSFISTTNQIIETKKLVVIGF